MVRGKLVQLLSALKVGTERRSLTWQDLPDEDMFRTHVGGGMVRIGKADGAKRPGYALWVLDNAGSIAAELEIFADDPDFPLIEEVYLAARLAARGGEWLLDNMIQVLVPNAPK